jgi:predicted RND superfamily exporter protein
MRRKVLRFIARITYEQPWAVLGFAGLLSFISILGLFHLSVETNVIDLLPPDSPVVRQLKKALNEFGTFDYMLIVIESKEPRDEDRLAAAAEKFAVAAYNREFINSIDYKLDPESRAYYLKNPDERFVSLLTASDWEAIQRKFSPTEILRELTRLKQYLLTVHSPEIRQRILSDPLNIESIIRNRLIHHRGPTKLNLRRGYFLSSDGRMLLMVVKPLKPSSDVFFTSRFMSFLNKTAGTVLSSNEQFRDHLSINFFGSHAEAWHDAAVIRKDFTNTTITSFICVITLFILAFRRLDALYFVGVPLLVGVLWTLGLTSFVIGRLTIVTFAFGAVLIGLGIDFAIHIFNRFAEEMRRGKEVSAALEIAIVETGEGIFTAAITTACAFYSMFVTSFKGFQEVGFVAGSGILCCLLSMYFILPALMTLRAKLGREPFLFSRFAGFGLRTASFVIRSNPRILIALALLITAYMGMQAVSVGFNDDLRSLREHASTYEALRTRIQSRFKLPSNQIIAIVSGKTMQEALQRNDKLYENIESPALSPQILACDSLRTLLPSPETQLASQARIRSLPLGDLAKNLRTQGRILGFAPEAFEPFLNRLSDLQSLARQGNIIEFGSIRSPLFVRLVQRYVTRSADSYRIITYIYPVYNSKWRTRIPQEFLDALKAGVGNVEFTGVTIIASELEHVVKFDLAMVVIVVSLVVFLILLVHFRSVVRAIFAMVPVMCAIIWMLGTMHLLGIQLNFINIVIIPMIIGIGVDNGIHILQRYYAEDERDLNIVVKSTGRAIVITSLTTILGFGSLALASYRGIQEMGLLAILGVGYSLIAGLFFLPPLLMIWEKRHSLLDFIGREDDEIR